MNLPTHETLDAIRAKLAAHPGIQKATITPVVHVTAVLNDPGTPQGRNDLRRQIYELEAELMREHEHARLIFGTCFEEPAGA